MRSFKLLTTMVVVAAALSSCVTITEKTDKKTGIKATVVAHNGCGGPSVTAMYIKRPGQKEDSAVFSGPDLCNTGLAAGLGAVGQIVSAGMIRPSNTTLVSGSFSQAQQGTSVRIGGH